MCPAASKGGTIQCLVRPSRSMLACEELIGRLHGTAVILAVSTTAANPLQALQDLTSRAFDFPPWVDLTSLRYFLIIHPSSSPLAEPMYVSPPLYGTAH